MEWVHRKLAPLQLLIRRRSALLIDCIHFCECEKTLFAPLIGENSFALWKFTLYLFIDYILYLVWHVLGNCPCYPSPKPSLTLTFHLGQNVGLGVGSITNRFSGKWAHTHPPKERPDACDFLCWFKPIMLPPADFRLAKIVAEIITTTQKVLPWSITCRSDFDIPETLGEILELEETNVLFDCLLWTFLLMIVVGEILHLQGSFQGALGLDNCVRYRIVTAHVYIWQRNIQYAGNSVW